jgi:hypothetical protein
MTMSRQIFLTIRRVSRRSYRQNQNTNFMFLMTKNIVMPYRPQIIISPRAGLVRLHALSRASTTHIHAPARTHTHTEICRIILIAFPLQQWFRERSSVLRCTYIACLINNNNNRELCLTNFYWYLCVYLCCT